MIIASEVSGPADWVASVLPQLFAADLHAPDPGPRGVATLDDLLTDDAARLRGLHAGLVADGATKQAAAHYLVGWFPGLVAAAVGYGVASAEAGLVLDSAEVRFHTVADGWPDQLDPGQVSAVVPAGHPWADLPGVTVRPGGWAGSAAATHTALVGLLTPFVQACQRLAPTRIASLWNEVADGLGHAVAHQRRLAVDQPMLDRLEAVLDQPDAPWNRRPRLGWASSPGVGVVHVAQKGGCCLAFTERPADPPEPDEPTEPEPSESEPSVESDLFSTHIGAYRDLFPADRDAKNYCSTCRFRDPDDVDARQVFWAERRPSAQCARASTS